MNLKKLFNAFNIIKILSGLILILCLAPDLLSATAPETTGTDKAPEILSGEPQKPPQNTGNNLVSIPEQAVNSNPNNISNIDQPQNQTASEPDPGSSTPPQIAPDGLTNTLSDQIQKAAPKGQTKVVKIKEYYRVKQGDTVGKIAARYHISSKKLMQLNNLKTDLIIIGRKLFIGIRDKVLEIPLVDEQEIKAEVSSFKETLIKEDTNDQNMSKIIGEKIAQTSLKYLGFPYKYGGESLWGMDCSAFVRRVLGFFDIEAPRTSREQFTFGEKTSLDKLIPGDLVFFTRGNSRNRRISHVGIYIGDNKFIHASGADKQVVISELTSPFYKQRYKGACRIINFYFPLLSPSLVETVQ